MLVFFTFFTLLMLIVLREKQIKLFYEKTLEDWILDTLGLILQGILIPFLQLKFFINFINIVGKIFIILSFCIP